MAFQGLDRADAPPPDTARRMLSEIGGRWWNVYIGGPESAGSGWSPRLVKAYVRSGIDRFMLTYVGRQSRGPLTRPQGTVDAREALALAASFGYSGAFPLCLDVELPTFETAPAKTTEYARAWCETVQRAGVRPGVYANPGPLEAMATANVPAQFVWIASWVAHSAGPRDPHSARRMPAGLWPEQGQRAWQYAAEFDGKKCRVLGFDVDISVADPGCLARAPGHHAGGEGNDAGPPFPGRVLALGMFGDDVERWQTRMRERGWRIQVTTKFDATSERICRRFQEEKSLDVTGRVDRKTWLAAWRTPVTP